LARFGHFSRLRCDRPRPAAQASGFLGGVALPLQPQPGIVVEFPIIEIGVPGEIIVKKLLFATVSVIAISATSAYAADMAVKAPPPPPLPAVYDWSGFYVGVNGGGGWSSNDWLSLTAPVIGQSVGSNTGSGGVAGGQFGWRTQAGSLVWGVDFMGDWANIKGSNTDLINNTFVDTNTMQHFGIFSATAGWAMNNVLVYVKGGGAWTGNAYRTASTTTASTATDTRWGGALGAGLEYGLTANWTIAVEYDHLFMGSVDNTYSGTGGGGVVRNTQDADLVTARINYKFGGPVVARY
jgi:outer membrane immunogenic protein